MARVSAALNIRVPAEMCFAFCRDGYLDERWRAAYRALRPGKDYSVQVMEEQPGERLLVSVAAIDSITGAQIRSLGYRIEFTFTPGDEGTRAEIAIEYGLTAAVMAAGTLEGQAENEVLHRLAQLIALERGYQAATARAEAAGGD